MLAVSLRYSIAFDAHSWGKAAVFYFYFEKLTQKYFSFRFLALWFQRNPPPRITTPEVTKSIFNIKPNAKLLENISQVS